MNIVAILVKFYLHPSNPLGKGAFLGSSLVNNKKSGRINPSVPSVIRLGLEGADAPSRAPCLHPPNPLDKGAFLGSSPPQRTPTKKRKTFSSLPLLR